MIADRAAAWLVRHARPLVAEGVCYGASDIAADAADTERSARQLAAQLPAGVRVWSSPLRRCTALSDALMKLRADLRYQTDTRLAEMDFGCWEGQRWSDIPRAAMDEWMSGFQYVRFGGRESTHELMTRVGAVWREAELSEQPWVWITHAGVIRAACLHARGVQSVTHSADWPRDAIAFGASVRIR